MAQVVKVYNAIQDVGVSIPQATALLSPYSSIQQVSQIYIVLVRQLKFWEQIT